MCSYEGFRLTAPSEVSVRSKARIDALFEDTRSVCSSTTSFAPWCPAAAAARYSGDDRVNAADGFDCCPAAGDSAGVNGDDGAESDHQQRRVNSAVQARIEAMFASVEAENSATGECSAAVLPVQYLGAAPVGGRVASVRGLQEPLRQLIERMAEAAVNAVLEVSRRGLTFRTDDLHEKCNPFRRIAVWSALKLHTKVRRGSDSKANDYLHAFVPLVADDRATSGSHPASSTIANSGAMDDRHADLYRTMRGLSNDPEDYPPIFAVVMRRPGAARLLECHAFACRCDEDAIAAAATLYRALLADLDATARRPRQRNGLGCASLASVVSSTTRDDTSPTHGSSSCAAGDYCPNVRHRKQQQEKQQQQQQPVRPPRIKKSSVSSTNTEDENRSTTTTSSSVVNVLTTAAVTTTMTTTATMTTSLTKAPLNRRKVKRETGIRAEDVLQAQNRRICSPPRESKTVDADVTAPIDRRRATSNNMASSDATKLEARNAERRKNAKNKSYTQQQQQQQPAIEKLYSHDEATSSSSQTRHSQPKLSSNSASSSAPSPDRERSGSFEFECCTDNSIYDGATIYGKSRTTTTTPRAGAANGGDKRATTRLPPINGGGVNSARKITTSNGSAASSRLKRPGVPPPDVPSSNTERRRRRQQRDHFRDADKIQSLGSTLVECPKDGRQASCDGSSSTHSRRLNRVNTLDRPIRQDSSSSERASASVQQQQQQQQQQQRRRSRAGSEPPTAGRTTDLVVSSSSSSATTKALLKRSQSDAEILVDKGDPMTRVELPRRGSFLKPGSVRGNRDGLEGGGSGTPLGFTELFDEFRNQEGLTSVDDILATIIDPEGMSFNDLKPLYKEFLLKLAATLTQDELYQRSASIMRRRRRTPAQRRRSSRRSGAGGKACLIRRAIKRSVSRLRSSSSAPTEFTSVLYPARKLGGERGGSFAGSTASSCERNHHHHRHRTNAINPNRVLSSKIVVGGGGGTNKNKRSRNKSSRAIGQHTTSEDSDTGRRPYGRGVGGGLTTANRSSSGYVSCSECSYNSESCTCISADKCYCSLPRRAMTPPSTPSSRLRLAAVDRRLADLAAPCACDTDSCSESYKCYCARMPSNDHQRHQHDHHRGHQQPSILEQLRQKGIVPAESTLSRHGSTEREKKSRRHSKNLTTSKSLEYLKVRSSSDNLALDYDLFSPYRRTKSRDQENSSSRAGNNRRRRSSRCSSTSGSEKVLVVSARDPQGRLIYVGGDHQHHHSATGGGKHRGGVGGGGDSKKHSRSVTADRHHHEALSIKKSAEIAAVFNEPPSNKLLGRRASSTSSLRSSVSLEAGLGYLP
ncbi:hypothetical protein TKK_0006541 [Trichogramma kaykai]|uniref:PID domain-containing protein n=1 Tax=Trichogramma kaykai TaxID=54128 RepID=A0ABD2XD22_9HYME